MDTGKEHPTAKEAAHFLGVSLSALEKGRIGYGQISPPYLKLGRSVRYKKQDLVAWAERARVAR